MPIRPAIIPCLRYEDAPAAILFLCDTFGFLPHAIYPDEEDQEIIHHAQLLLDGNMIMLSSARDEEEDDDPHGWVQPEDAGGVTMTIYVTVADLAAHYKVATEAGAQIVSPLKDNEGYPGQGYTARDPEGQMWSFGSYDPFAPMPVDA